MAWFYATQSGRHGGPLSWDDIKVFVRNGNLLPSDLVWVEGMSEWRSASSIEGLLTDASARNGSSPRPDHGNSVAWYYAHNGTSTGPATWDELLRLAGSGALRPQHLVWCEGMPEWKVASSIENLFHQASPPPDPSAVKLAPLPAPSVRMIKPERNPGAERSKPPSTVSDDGGARKRRWIIGLGVAACAVVGLYAFAPRRDVTPVAADNRSAPRTRAKAPTPSASPIASDDTHVPSAPPTLPSAATKTPASRSNESSSLGASEDSSITDHCEADATGPQGPEDRSLIANGRRYLTGRALRAGKEGEIYVVEAAIGYDGQCRPDPYQIYVFVRGVEVGTLSPQAMHARSDGAISSFSLADDGYLQVAVARYAPGDPACCPSSYENRKVSLSQFMARAPSGDAQGPSQAVAQSTQVTAQGVPVLEQSSRQVLWTQADNGREVSWFEAQSHCSAQGIGWRLPSTGELAGIYDSSGQSTVSCGKFICKVSPLFHLSAGGYWTNVEVGSTGASVFVLDGGTTYQGRKDGGGNVRALCVRDIQAGADASAPAVTGDAPNTAPSFDCLKATSGTEYAICGSPELSALDGELGRLFRNAVASLPSDQGRSLRGEQVAWIKARNDACSGDESCLRAYLKQRISVLSGVTDD